MLGALVMRCSNTAWVAMGRRSAGAMHGAGHDRNSRSAQRRDPWREESYDKRNGDEAAYHDLQIYNALLKAKCLSGIPSREESEIQRRARSLRSVEDGQSPPRSTTWAARAENCTPRSQGQ